MTHSFPTRRSSDLSIKAILQAPPFKNPETLTRYRLGEETAETPETDEAPGWLKAWFKWMSGQRFDIAAALIQIVLRSEEHTSELQSLMRQSYAVFCLKKIT